MLANYVVWKQSFRSHKDMKKNHIQKHTGTENTSNKIKIKTHIQQDTCGEFGLLVDTFMKWRRLIVIFSSTTQAGPSHLCFKWKQRCDYFDEH